jgi:hypothetical protein
MATNFLFQSPKEGGKERKTATVGPKLIKIIQKAVTSST